MALSVQFGTDSAMTPFDIGDKRARVKQTSSRQFLGIAHLLQVAEPQRASDGIQTRDLSITTLCAKSSNCGR